MYQIVMNFVHIIVVKKYTDIKSYSKIKKCLQLHIKLLKHLDNKKKNSMLPVSTSTIKNILS